ncbi:MAG: hypothetical protein AABO58_14540 [Acidobacteriota bacterium]
MPIRRLALLILAIVPCASAQTTFVRDAFTVGANTMLEAHAPNAGGAWTRFTGGSGIILNAAADNARNVANNDWNIYGNATTPPGAAAEIVVGITVTFTNNTTNNYVDVFGRASVALLNGYLARLRASNDGTGTNVQIVRYVGGAPPSP